MKKLFYLAMALWLTGALALTVSCNKKKSAEVCNIQKLLMEDYEYNFSYDEHFRISKIESGDKITNYSYNRNQITILTTASGMFYRKHIITTNDAGLVMNFKTEINPSGSIWTNEAYTYNGNQISTSVSTTSAGPPGDRSLYIWSAEGNLLKIINEYSPDTEFSYNTRQAFQEGDYANVSNLIDSKYPLYRTKNLVESISSHFINYDFDTNNKITRISPKDAKSVQVTYICK